jgi:hypothetical protein
MGCDMHLHVEVKVHGIWRHYNHPDIKRDYTLFAKMAGVRNWPDSGIVPLSSPKGVPNGLSLITAYDLEWHSIDSHSHSYLSAEEIKELSLWKRYDSYYDPLWLEHKFGFLFGNTFAWFLEQPEEYLIEDVRFVFWFLGE